MKYIKYILEVLAYFAGLININLEYVKLTEWPNRVDTGNSSRSNNVDDDAQSAPEAEGENFTPSEGISSVINNQSADISGDKKPYGCCDGVRPVHARNCKWYKPDISEQ